MNIAETILRKHDDSVFRIALQEVKSEGINTYSFGGLDYLSDKFATVLSESGITQSDVVAVMLPQSAAFAVAHLAILKMGAIVLPVSFTAEQSLIERILKESGAKCLVIDESIQQRFINLIRESLNL
jgi:acetyl-CoA synthetase